MAAPTGETATYASKNKSAQARIRVGLDYPALVETKIADFSVDLDPAEFSFSWLTSSPEIDVGDEEVVIYSRGAPPYEWFRTREHWIPAAYDQPFTLAFGVKFPQADPVYSPIIIVGGIENTFADLDEPLIMYQHGTATTDAALGPPSREGDVVLVSNGSVREVISYTPGDEIIVEIEWDPDLAVNSSRFTLKIDLATVFESDTAPRPEYVQFGWAWGTETARRSDSSLLADGRPYGRGDPIPALGTFDAPEDIMRITGLSVDELGSEGFESRTYPAWIRERSILSNGHFNTNTTGWVGGGAAIARVTGIRREGAGALEINTAGSSSNEGAEQVDGQIVLPSTQYNVSLFLRQEAAGSCHIQFVEYTALDAFITAQSSGEIELDTITGLYDWSHQQFNFTTGGTTGIVRIFISTFGTQNLTFYADEVLMVLGDTSPLLEEDNSTWAYVPMNKVNDFRVMRSRVGLGDSFAFRVNDDGTDEFATTRWHERPVYIDTKVGAASWKRQIAAYALQHEVSAAAESQSVTVNGRAIAAYQLDTFLNRSYFGDDSVGGTEAQAGNIGYNVGEITRDLLDVSYVMHGGLIGPVVENIKDIDIIPFNIGTGGQSLLSVFTSLFDQVACEYWLRNSTSGANRRGCVMGHAWNLGTWTPDHTFDWEAVFDWNLTEDVTVGPGQVSYRQNLLVEGNSNGQYSTWYLPTPGLAPTHTYPAKAAVLNDSVSFAKTLQATAIQSLVNEDDSTRVGGIAQHRLRLENEARRMVRFTVLAQDWIEPSDELAITDAPGQLDDIDGGPTGETWVVDTIDISFKDDELRSTVTARTSRWFRAMKRGG